mmetsp:Transcript_137466/g.383360  ORF Transcript_137466/g.383360 Transcript_137466/m.383360 type:complete len:345 (-) Transcript_137466:155-1189(-)
MAMTTPEPDERDKQIAELEALVAQQRERMAQLEALAEAEREDARQLHELLEAQEAALNEQRQVVESQSGLVDELHRQLQAQLCGRQREAELEALAEQQGAQIARLEAEGRRRTAEGGEDPGDEAQQLRAIVEAQEAALDDQRQIIASQSSLIDELNGHVQAHISGHQYESSTPRLGSLVDIPECTEMRGDGGPVAGPPAPGATSARSSQRRRPAEASPPPAAPARSHATGLARRSHREQHLAQQKAFSMGSGHLHQQGARELPRPRPNSVLGGRSLGGSGGSSSGSGGTPRARSTTTERLSSRGSSPQPVRGSSPHASSRQQPGMPRRAGGPVPPTLPLLRQEA